MLISTSRPGFRIAGAAFVCLVVLLGEDASSREAVPSGALDIGATSAHPLEGRRFLGEIRDEKGTVRFKDVLTFSNGQFQSQKYRAFGFGDSPYWTRIERGVVHFLVESADPAAGKMVFRGEVRGDHVEWKGVWTKKRWYWTIRRDVSFIGTKSK